MVWAGTLPLRRMTQLGTFTAPIHFCSSQRARAPLRLHDLSSPAEKKSNPRPTPIRLELMAA